jgi:hypothetical protein
VKTRVTRGKVSVDSMSRLKGRATPIRKDADCRSACSVNSIGVVILSEDERLPGNGWSRLVYRNRERELGLDRRETG